jgi:hypothetical protein
MRLKQNLLVVPALVAVVGLFNGCAIGQSAPPAPRPFGEIASEEHGEVVSVHDTMIDLRTGQARALHSSGPLVPIGPVAIPVPITIGGEKRREVPGEEITVRLPEGKLILVVQELSQPAFAVGEQVRVLHEQPGIVSGVSRTRVERQ